MSPSDQPRPGRDEAVWPTVAEGRHPDLPSDRDHDASEGIGSELLYHGVIAKCAAGLAVLDVEGEFHEANPAFCELVGYSRAVLAAPGFKLEQLIHPDEAASYRQHLSALARGEEETYRQLQRLLRPDSVVVAVELSMSLVRNESGVPSRLVLTAVDLTEQTRAENAFRDLSLRDALTKLPNRRLLRDRLQGAIARAKREERSVALLFLDLDGFKSINDTRGHEVGDWLLKAVAKRLTACLRESDTAARQGGDEFVILLPDLQHREVVTRVAERIRAALAAPFITEIGKPLQISCSIGVSLFPDHGDSDRELLQASDEAMYLVKRSGKNQIAFSQRVPTPTPAAIPRPMNDLNSGLVHLTWEAKFASGNAFIDAEHRELFRHSNQLLDLTTRAQVPMPEVRAGLERLVRAVGAHFGHEERILAQIGYPELAAHAARHRRLMERAEALCRLPEDQSIPMGEILDFVVAQMIHGHIVTEDREYFHLLEGRTDL
jgi:diguanylate cyclase (GGDEF)-like protein/hemerythrin-like metal-binding protein/PAS domain S-box-containing protein